MRCIFLGALIIATLAASFLSSSAPADADPSFGLSPGSPTLGIIAAPPGNVLNPAAGSPGSAPGIPPPLLPPVSVIALPAVLNVDAISYGNDPVLSAAGQYVTFSVDNVTGGIPGGTGPADVSFNTAAADGAPADIYLKSGPGAAIMPVPPPPFACLGVGGNHIVVDADGLLTAGPLFPFPNTPGMGLVEPPGALGAPGRDDLDQLDMSDFSVVGPIGPPPAGEIFFSVDPTSVPALGGPVAPFATANSAADIFVTGGFAGAAILRFADAANLGLAVGNNIDALSVDYTSGAATWPAGGAADEIVFSLALGSPGLGVLPHHCAAFVRPAGAADLFMKGAAVGSGPFAVPAPYLDAEEMGLCTPAIGGCFLAAGDNVDEIDMGPAAGLADLDGDLRPNDVDTDDDADGIGDFIDNCPLLFNPGQADNEGDGIGDDCDPDDDNDGFLDGGDNCPLDSNPTQDNFDDSMIGNGPPIVPNDDTVPNGDGDGDACDDDDDNDGLPDTEDLNPLPGVGVCAAFAGATDAHPNAARGDITQDDNLNSIAAPPMGGDAADNGPSWDTDGDGARDGVECALGRNPRSRLSRPTMAVCGGVGDADGDGLFDGAELCKWGTGPGAVNSDGDALGDCTEAADIDGDGLVTFPGDVLGTASAFFFSGSDVALDIDGDGLITFPGDVLRHAAYFFATAPCL